MAVGLLESAQLLRSALASFDPALVSGDDAAVVAEELALTEKVCAAGRARAAVRAAECRSHERRGFADAADWLARASGSTRGEAQAAMAMAAAVDPGSLTGAALVAGEVSVAQAQIIRQTEADCPGSESELLDLARRSSVAGLQDEGRRRRHAAADPDELHRRQHRSRELRHWRDALGMVRLAGALPPEVGIPIVNRLDAETDRIRRAATKSEPDPPTPPTPSSSCWRARARASVPRPTWCWCATSTRTAEATLIPGRCPTSWVEARSRCP